MEKEHRDLTSGLKTCIDMSSWTWIGWFDADSAVKVIDDYIEKDYFTKEFINRDATNTKVLYVVAGTHIEKKYFKEWNQWNTVMTIRGKFYYFND